MKKSIAVLAVVSMVFVGSCYSAEPTKKEIPKEAVTTQAPPVKAPTLDELKSQRIMLQLQLQGAEIARNAVSSVIDKGRVDLELLDRQIQAMTPKKEEEKK